MSLTIISAKEPIYTSQDESSIHLLVKFAEISEEIQFNAMPTDSEAHGVELYKRAKAGEFGAIAPFVPSIPVPVTNQPTTTGTQAA
jgi:hypothetical protein